MKNVGIISIGFLFYCAANAGPQCCKGLIKYSYLHQMVAFIYWGWRSEHTRVCNINNDSSGVTVETCKRLALAAKLSQTIVVVQYSEVLSYAKIPRY